MDTLLPVALLLILAGFGGLVVRSVRRRKDFLSTVTNNSAALPDLETELRLTGTLRRLWRDPQEGLPLAELGVGSRRFIFCTTDQATSGERYKAAVGKSVTVALYGLATLAPGGSEAMREQLRDADRVAPDTVTLVHEGQLENDYVVIGRLLSHRPHLWGEVPLMVYRAQVLRTDDLTLILELAVPSPQSDVPLPDDSLAHGSVRLFGYLP